MARTIILGLAAALAFAANKGAHAADAASNSNAPVCCAIAGALMPQTYSLTDEKECRGSKGLFHYRVAEMSCCVPTADGPPCGQLALPPRHPRPAVPAFKLSSPMQQAAESAKSAVANSVGAGGLRGTREKRRMLIPLLLLPAIASAKAAKAAATAAAFSAKASAAAKTPAGVVATSVGTGAVGTYIGKQWVSAAQEAECRDAIATGQVLEHCTAHVAADHFWTEYYKNADCPNNNRDNCIKMVCEAAGLSYEGHWQHYGWLSAYYSGFCETRK